ncbi:MAG: hypothetical protein ACI379_13890 [Nocardioides sp.]|uniref:hypothetical protein n=1 Tax=Nocardioides sp. TaxID=35761 RepID=UPI003F0BBEEC
MHLRSELTRWALLCLAVVALGVFGMARTPYTDTTTTGSVVGHGFNMGGGGCYLNIEFTADGAKHSFKTRQEQRWCGVGAVRRKPTRPIVHYAAADPDRATLTPRGRGPELGVLLGGVGLLALGVAASRRTAREPQLASSPLARLEPECSGSPSSGS